MTESRQKPSSWMQLAVGLLACGLVLGPATFVFLRLGDDARARPKRVLPVSSSQEELFGEGGHLLSMDADGALFFGKARIQASELLKKHSPWPRVKLPPRKAPPRGTTPKKPPLLVHVMADHRLPLEKFLGHLKPLLAHSPRLRLKFVVRRKKALAAPPQEPLHKRLLQAVKDAFSPPPERLLPPPHSHASLELRLLKPRPGAVRAKGSPGRRPGLNLTWLLLGSDSHLLTRGTAIPTGCDLTPAVLSRKGPKGAACPTEKGKIGFECLAKCLHKIKKEFPDEDELYVALLTARRKAMSLGQLLALVEKLREASLDLFKRKLFAPRVLLLDTRSQYRRYLYPKRRPRPAVTSGLDYAPRVLRAGSTAAPPRRSSHD